MKTILLLFLVHFGFSIAKAQTIIKLEDINQHIGDSITVCGKVESMRYFENSKRKPTLLNMGAAFPNQLLSVLIWDETRALFTGKLEDLLNKEICITGRLILYKEKPEIIIQRPDQLVVQK